MAKHKIAFSEAKQDKGLRLRQDYLSTIMQSCPESVSEMIYDPRHLLTINYAKKLFNENSLSKDGVESIINHSYSHEATASVIFPHSLLGAGKQHPIFVFKAAFNGVDSEASILNMQMT